MSIWASQDPWKMAQPGPRQDQSLGSGLAAELPSQQWGDCPPFFCLAAALPGISCLCFCTPASFCTPTPASCSPCPGPPALVLGPQAPFPQLLLINRSYSPLMLVPSFLLGVLRLPPRRQPLTLTCSAGMPRLQMRI